MKNSYEVLVEKPEGRDYSEEIGINGKTILEWILGKMG
jgi:hypothetical protein